MLLLGQRKSSVILWKNTTFPDILNLYNFPRYKFSSMALENPNTYAKATQWDNNDLFAVMVSGKNPDETPWAGMPIQGEITTTPGAATSSASAPSSVSVGLTSAQAVASFPGRKGLILTSLLANTGRICLSLNGTSAELDKGIVLYPGDSFSMDDRSFSTAQINAISSVAAQALAIQELS